MVSNSKIRDLAVTVQQAVNNLQKRNTPIEHVEIALQWINHRPDEIDLATASTIQVLPLVQARLEKARLSFLRRQRPTLGEEIHGMFKTLTDGSRRQKMAIVTTR